MGSFGIGLGVGLLAPAGYLAARHGFRQPAGAARRLGAVVLAWAWVTIGVEALGSLGLLARWPLVAWSAVGLLIGAMLRFASPGPADPVVARAPARPGPAATIALGLLIWATARLGVFSLIYPVKVVSDGPIYHLYFAARWWRAGRVFRVASPFGEVGATYFWANGEAWFAWLLTLWGGDTLAKLGQLPFLAVAVSTAGRDGPAGRGLGLVGAGRLGLVRHDHAPVPLRLSTRTSTSSSSPDTCSPCYFLGRYALGDDGWNSLALAASRGRPGDGDQADGDRLLPPPARARGDRGPRPATGRSGPGWGISRPWPSCPW